MSNAYNEGLRQLADSAAKYSAVMSMKSYKSANELFVEHLVQSVVQECVRRIEGCSIDPTQYEFDRDLAFIQGYNKAISKSASHVLEYYENLIRKVKQ